MAVWETELKGEASQSHVRKAPACPGKEFAFDLKAVGAIESFIRREGGPVRFALGKPPLAAAEWRLVGLEKVNAKIKSLSLGPVISHRGWAPFTAQPTHCP